MTDYQLPPGVQTPLTHTFKPHARDAEVTTHEQRKKLITEAIAADLERKRAAAPAAPAAPEIPEEPLRVQVPVPPPDPKALPPPAHAKGPRPSAETLGRLEKAKEMFHKLMAAQQMREALEQARAARMASPPPQAQPPVSTEAEGQRLVRDLFQGPPQ